MKASDLFRRCLEAEGVEYIFGVPGEENADIMISLLDSSIRFIICRHEQGAAFMADLYGRLTGRPGVCLATLGPGATNLVTGVANAHMDRSPLVALTGDDIVRLARSSVEMAINVVNLFICLSSLLIQAEPIPRAQIVPKGHYTGPVDTC